MTLLDILTGVRDALKSIGFVVASILFIAAGLVYAYGQMQPAESRGKYSSVAMGCLAGGFIIAALSAGSEYLLSIGKTILPTA